MNYEIQLIACCLLDNELIKIAMSKGVQPGWFNDELNQRVWTEMVKRFEMGKSVDIVWADNYERTTTGRTELVFIEATHNVLSPKSEVMSAIEIMKRDYMKTQISDILSNVSRRLNCEDPDALISEMIEKLDQLKQGNNGESVEDIKEKIVEELKRGIECPTHFSRLDYLVKGIEPGVLWVIGGHTSNGKTTFALNLAYNLAQNSHPVTFFSTEMSKKLLTKRVTTMISGINPSIASSLTEEEKEAYIKELPNALNLPIEMYSTLSLPEIRMTIQKKKSRLYIVDYIQMIHPGIFFENEVKKLGYIVRELERLTKEYNVCIIATSQFNRSKDGAPTLSSYRGSGEIEENTDIGILMNYPYQQAPFEKKQEIKDADKDKIIMVAVQKNRIHGLTGTISFEFDPKIMRMKEQSHDM